MISLSPGLVIARKIRLDREIARGGMGSVWSALNTQLEAPVAVKFMSPNAVGSPELVARFQREAKAAAQIRSPHVVQIFEHGMHLGLPYIVMELLDGEDLGMRLRRDDRLSVVETAEIVAQVCKALRRAHEMGIVHRDLKPANVFLARHDDDEIVKVLDFGIAKSLGPSSDGDDTTQTGTLVGTPHYMSPEQAQRSKQIDARSDLWSLGVIAFRALTGRVPFKGDDMINVLVKVCTESAPPPSSFAPELGPEIDALFARALSRDIDARFQSAREMADAFFALTGRRSMPSDLSFGSAVLPPPSARSGVPEPPPSTPGPAAPPPRSSRPDLYLSGPASSRSPRPEVLIPAPAPSRPSRPDAAIAAPAPSRPSRPDAAIAAPASSRSPRPDGAIPAPPRPRPQKARSRSEGGVTVFEPPPASRRALMPPRDREAAAGVGSPPQRGPIPPADLDPLAGSAPPPPPPRASLLFADSEAAGAAPVSRRGSVPRPDPAPISAADGLLDAPTMADGATRDESDLSDLTALDAVLSARPVARQEPSAPAGYSASATGAFTQVSAGTLPRLPSMRSPRVRAAVALGGAALVTAILVAVWPGSDHASPAASGMVGPAIPGTHVPAALPQAPSSPLVASGTTGAASITAAAGTTGAASSTSAASEAAPGATSSAAATNASNTATAPSSASATAPSTSARPAVTASARPVSTLKGSLPPKSTSAPKATGAIGGAPKF